MLFTHSAQFPPARSHLFREYLFHEFLRKSIFTCLLRAQMGLIHEIKKILKNAEKSRDTATLSAIRDWNMVVLIVSPADLALNNYTEQLYCTERVLRCCPCPLPRMVYVSL